MLYHSDIYMIRKACLCANSHKNSAYTHTQHIKILLIFAVRYKHFNYWKI